MSVRACVRVVPDNGLLLRRRPAHAAQQVRRLPARGDGALLRGRDGACDRLGAPAQLRAPVRSSFSPDE